jgi:hypothetical protein
MAELHGAQRSRLGWSEEDLERDTRLLRVEVERTLESAVGGPATAHGEGTAAIGEVGIDPSARRAAVQYAGVVTRHVLDQAASVALRAHRATRVADAP